MNTDRYATNAIKKSKSKNMANIESLYIFYETKVYYLDKKEMKWVNVKS